VSPVRAGCRAADRLLAPIRLSFGCPGRPPEQLGCVGSRIGENRPHSSRSFATSDSSRTKRFALPDLHDARAEEVIDAYIAGPRGRRGRRDGTKTNGTKPGTAVALDNRIAWNEALAQESARSERYRRPASVVVVRAQARPGSEDELAVSRLAQPIGHVLRRGARETDFVTRVADGRFHILMPETGEDEAVQFAERVLGDCEIWIRATGAPVVLRSAAAAATAERSLEAALEHAIEVIDSD
jgi:hypothetical protein